MINTSIRTNSLTGGTSTRYVRTLVTIRNATCQSTEYNNWCTCSTRSNIGKNKEKIIPVVVLSHPRTTTSIAIHLRLHLAHGTNYIVHPHQNFTNHEEPKPSVVAFWGSTTNLTILFSNVDSRNVSVPSRFWPCARSSHHHLRVEIPSPLRLITIIEGLLQSPSVVVSSGSSEDGTTIDGGTPKNNFSEKPESGY